MQDAAGGDADAAAVGAGGGREGAGSEECAYDGKLRAALLALVLHFLQVCLRLRL